MISVRDTVAAVVGGVRLIGGDVRGLGAMDVSVDGFWRSFVAVILLAPALFLSLAVDLGGAPMPEGVEESAGTVAIVSAGVLAYLLGWVLFPMVVGLLARPLALGRVFVPWMVARNWTSIPAAVPYAVVVALWLAGLLPDRLLAGASLAALGFSLYCGWCVARLVAGQPVMAALAFTLLDFLLGLFAEVAVDRLFGL